MKLIGYRRYSFTSGYHSADMEQADILAQQNASITVRDIAIALGIGGGAMVSLGFTRFSYALLLPRMHTALHWSYAEAGAMNTSSALGYIIGAAASAWAVRRFTDRIAFIASMALAALALLLNAATADFTHLMALRFAGGVVTAVTFVTGAGLASRIDPHASRARSSFLLAIFFAGPALGIIVSALIIPAALAYADWPAGWLAMGVVSLLALIPAAFALAYIPRAAASHGASLIYADFKLLAPSALSYTLFGFGYIGYMTFSVAYIRAEGLGADTATAFFLILGTASVVATLAFWRHVLAIFPRGYALALCGALLVIGALVILVTHGTLAAWASGAMFGASMLAAPAAVSVLARRVLPPERLTAGFGFLTFVFALGQAAGPFASGYLSDHGGSLQSGLWLSVAALAGCAVTALRQR
jgi:predicted MFS family arabinose efflux permease